MRKPSPERTITRKDTEKMKLLLGSAKEQYVKLLVRTLDDIQRQRVGTGNRIEAFRKTNGENYAEICKDLEEKIWGTQNKLELKLAADLGKAVAELG